VLFVVFFIPAVSENYSLHLVF